MNLLRRLSLFSLSVLLVGAALGVSLVLPVPSHAATQQVQLQVQVQPTQAAPR